MYSLFDPIGHDNTKNIEGEFDGNELSAGGVLGSLGGPDWNNSVKHSGTPSVDETSADHPDVVLSRSLESSSDDGPASSETNSLDTAITVTEPTTDKTAHKSTEIVDGDNATLKQGVVDDWSSCFWIWMTEFHGFLVIVQRTIDTTHHTLIISKEEDGETSNTIDGSEKATLFKLMNHVGPGNDVHVGNYPEYCLSLEDVSLLNVVVEEKIDALLGVGEADIGAESGEGGVKIRR